MINDIYQDFIHKKTYARWIDEENRRESWNDTVDRLYDYLKYKTPQKLQSDLETAIDMVRNKEIMPSMRLLWTAGKAAEKDQICTYNCSFTVLDSIKSLPEMMHILMNGTGVGYSVENQYIMKLPSVPNTIEKSSNVIVFEDSRIGWSKGFYKYLRGLYNGVEFKYDTSKLRPKGARLKTSGGRSSGPEPLIDLLEFTKKKFYEAKGRKLTSDEVSDIATKIAEIVVSGGFRRSACIGLTDLNDLKMKNYKVGEYWITNPYRALVNVSAVYNEKPSIDLFMDEWISLMKSGTGERGIVNRYSAKKIANKIGRCDSYEFGVNPCSSGDTRILTKEGYEEIQNLVDKEVFVWNGEEWSKVKPFSTGKNKILKVTLSNGVELKCTYYHEFILANGERVEAKDLKIGDKLAKFEMPIIRRGKNYKIDAYSQGFYAGDGNENYTYSYIYKPKFNVIKRLKVGKVHNVKTEKHRKRWVHGVMLPKFFVPINGSLGYKINWLAGLIDADGCKVYSKSKNKQDSFALQIASTNKKFLEDIRLMLTTLGCDAKISTLRKEGFYDLPDGKGGYKQYFTNTSYRLNISNFHAQKLIDLGLKCERIKLDKRKLKYKTTRYIKVTKLEHCGTTETFCFTEPKAHRGTFEGIVTGQCSEIVLRPKQFCNLSTVIIKQTDNEQDLEEKIKYATFLGTLQATFDKFKFISKEWYNNTIDERLLGVSLAGICDNKITADPDPKFLEKLYQTVRSSNKEYAKILNIKPAVAVTAVKPAGNTSQLVGCSSGINPGFSEYYIRRVRVSTVDPLCRYLMDKGVPNHPEVGDDEKNPKTRVFEFPIHHKAEVYRDDLSAIEQLELWKKYKVHYTDHNPSVTIFVKDDEWLKVGAWVYDNFDIIGGLSFLPYDGGVYKLMPYEEIDSKTYKKLIEEFPKNLDFDKELNKYEKDDNTTGNRELACTGGQCDIF